MPWQGNINTIPLDELSMRLLRNQRIIKTPGTPDWVVRNLLANNQRLMEVGTKLYGPNFMDGPVGPPPPGDPPVVEPRAPPTARRTRLSRPPSSPPAA